MNIITGKETDQLINPQTTSDFLGEVGFNFSFDWFLLFAVVRLHFGDLFAVGWGEGPWAFVTPVKAMMVWVRDYIKSNNGFQYAIGPLYDSLGTKDDRF